jgi:hypothetical protein
MTSQPVADVDEVWEKSQKEAVVLAPSRQAAYLLKTIGPRMSAAALGLTDARPFKAWAKDLPTAGPGDHASIPRLALLFQVVYAIIQTQGAAVAALFLRSSNPQLDDEPPLMVIRDDTPELARSRVLAATRAFLEG